MKVIFFKWPKLFTIVKRPITDAKDEDPGRWRDIMAFWILGLCNNYGYVVMLSAAYDIIHRTESKVVKPDEEWPPNQRICQVMSTGAILIADVIPGLTMKTLGPFLPFSTSVRVFMTCFAQATGFLLVALADSRGMALAGVAFTSFSAGFGETSLISYSSKFHRNVVSAWSSGTGGAGFFGSFSYALLIDLGLTPVTTMLVMLIIPLLEAFTFWVMLRKPQPMSVQNSDIEMKATPSNQKQSLESLPELTLIEKFRYMPSLLKYMIPISTVYFFEFFINQGLFELIHFQNIFLDRPHQYRWLQVDYQMGVFISRSSVNVLPIDKIWLMSVFQFINVVIMLTEVITFFSPTIWIVFGIVFWEGLLGGSAYVNTFYRMSQELPEDKRHFSLGIVTLADAVGVLIAGLIAIPAHNALCQLPRPIRNELF